MIHELQIYAFKMFAEASFKMAPLTILAGMNGAGKTSVALSLLLIREVTRRDDKIAQLNGPHGLELGTFGDIQNWNTQDPVRFVLTDKNSNVYSWELGGNPTSLYADIQKHPQKLPLFFNEGERLFQYLCAERYGPPQHTGFCRATSRTARSRISWRIQCPGFVCPRQLSIDALRRDILVQGKMMQHY